MHNEFDLLAKRIARTYRERIAPTVRSARIAVETEAWEVPGEPVSFEKALAATYTPLAVGTRWGRPWGTTWMHVRGEVPADWIALALKGSHAVELVIGLGFASGTPGFQAEGLVRTPDGTVIKGLEPMNDWVATDGQYYDFYIEAASNPDVGSDWSFAPTPLGDLATAGDEPLYSFDGVWLALRDQECAALERDWATLESLAKVLPEHSPRRAGILRSLERAADVLNPDHVAATAAAARAELAGSLAQTAASSSHRVSAIGHSHLDSAWLWPLRETIRKAARTFSNALDLMERSPDFVFAASSAQQYAWVKEFYPDVFARIRSRVAEGRWIPVGGMWVESDTNMPGGEALVRQFVAGKGFFLREFDVETTEAWLPDSFGYSGALPQIVQASASDYFLTQKVSWNETNVVPHHTFFWEGIDGTRVFTHFPPVDTYNSDLGAVDLARAEMQNAERGILDLSLVPFGYGDGGGGPTREMMETARRKRDLDGSPKVTVESPSAFFAQARAGHSDPAVWSGELYLEFHRGTYTSQAATKLGNRRNEHLLREAELWAATASVRHGSEYPADALRSAWETVLLLQFHDILPGSSIAWVHQDAEARHSEVTVALERVIGDALATLGGTSETEARFNAAPVVVDGVPPLSAAAVASGPPATSASRVAESDDRFVLESEHLRAVFDSQGTLTSFVDLASGREVVPPGGAGNVLQLFRDTPTQWDAWDVDKHFNRTPLPGGSVVTIRIEGSELAVVRRVGSSIVTQRLRLSPSGRALDIETSVDWREKQKLLKLAFDIDVLAETAASEIQFGHIRRPVPVNTSWDAARFETVAHRWIHVDEPGFGVTIANDRVYGHDVSRIPREGGGAATRVRESLLRAPLFPDPGADAGVQHEFRHSISVGGVLDAAAEGYRLNLQLRSALGANIEPLVSIGGSESVLIEAVKLAEDGSGDVVVRIYEASGGRCSARLLPGFECTRAVRTDLLERPLPEQPADALQLDLRPFELVTVRLHR